MNYRSSGVNPYAAATMQLFLKRREVQRNVDSPAGPARPGYTRDSPGALRPTSEEQGTPSPKSHGTRGGHVHFSQDPSRPATRKKKNQTVKTRGSPKHRTQIHRSSRAAVSRTIEPSVLYRFCDGFFKNVFISPKTSVFSFPPLTPFFGGPTLSHLSRVLYLLRRFR